MDTIFSNDSGLLARNKINGNFASIEGDLDDTAAALALKVDGDNVGGRANIYKTLRLDVSDDGGVSNPKLEFNMANARWRMGGDNANGVPGSDFVPVVLVTPSGAPVQDNVYCSFQGTQGDYPNSTAGTIVRYGFGVTPPNTSYRLQTAGGTTGSYPDVGGFSSLVRQGQTGHAYAMVSSSGAARWWVDADGYVSGNHTSGYGVAIKADATNQRPLLLSKSDGSAGYGFSYSGNSLRFTYPGASKNILQFDTTGAFRHLSDSLGFYGAVATAKPVVTGSVGGNAALSSLISALATLGLITNSTTA